MPTTSAVPTLTAPVVVAEVPVAFWKVKFWRVVEPLSRRFVKFPVVPNRFVEKKFVVVAAVPVAFANVKFWRVVEPVCKRFAIVTNPPVAFNVPVKLEAEEMFWPLINPDEITFANRFVVEALFETKRLVVVAPVVVLKMLVKFWRVVDDKARRFVRYAIPSASKSPDIYADL